MTAWTLARGPAPSRPLGHAGAALAVAGSCAALGFGAALAPQYTALAGLLGFGLASLFLVPIEVLPLLTLLWLALVPVNDLPLPAVARAASPGLVIVLVWALRREVAGAAHPSRALPAPLRTTILLLLGWLLVMTLATISLSRSLVWDIAFGGTVLLPLAIGFTKREARLVVDGLVALGALLAIYAVGEFLLKHNPLFGHLYERAPFPVEERWSTYRVTTALGHPLNNALFFAAASVAGFSRYLETRRTLYAAGFLLALVGLLLSGSRGALYLTPVCLVAVVAMQVRAGALSLQRLGRLALIAGVGLAVLFGLYSQTVGLRANSTEGRVSTDVRYRALEASLHASSRREFLGSGPGTSNSADQEDIQNPADVGLVIENSYLQLLVSIGLPGLVGVVALFGGLVWFGFRRRNIAAAGAFLAMALVIGTYNFIEGVRPDLLFLGVLGAACLATPSDRPEGADAPAL